MSKYYFDSDKIQVFPCANRSADEASRFTTEYNLTRLGSYRTQIISSAPQYPGSTVQLIQCWIKGYYFKFRCDPTAAGFPFPAGTNLYLQIYISDTTNIPASVGEQGKLISFNGSTLDSDGKFYGARLTDESSTLPSLLLKKDGNWLTATIPSYLRLLGTDNNIYRITVETDGTIKATKES